MRTHRCLGALAALVVTQGTVTTAAAAPAWCTDGSDKPTYSVKTMFTDTDAWHALTSIVAASCYPDDDLAGMGAKVEALRATWSKKLALKDRDWKDVAPWAHPPMGDRGANTVELGAGQAAYSTYTPFDQLGLLGTSLNDTDAAYVADAFGKRLSQLGRLGYVRSCINTSADDPAVQFAMCAADVAALDMAKLDAEIRAEKKRPLAERMTARLIAYETLTEQVPKYLEKVKVLRAKDPAYEKMFELAAQAQRAWAGVDASLVALVDGIDDARISGSRRAAQGCGASSWDAWKTQVAAIPAKQLATIYPEPGKEFGTALIAILAGTPSGYLAALALNECATLEDKHDALTDAIGLALQRWPGFRGTRTATQTMILTAGLELDQRDQAITYPEVTRSWITGTGMMGTTGVGGVKSIAVDGDTATVTFANVKVTQTRCVKGHSTNRIRQITADGTFVYWYVCDKEITETIEVPPSPPLKVRARYVTGIKPGMSVRVSEDVVGVAYPGKGTTPAIVTGVAVK